MLLIYLAIAGYGAKKEELKNAKYAIQGTKSLSIQVFDLINRAKFSEECFDAIYL